LVVPQEGTQVRGASIKLARRKFLLVATSGAALPSISRLASAETYPSRPVHLIVGAVPGSAPDVIARLAAQWLSERLGQSFVVENRNGASGNLATEAVVHAQPDGYTLLLVSASNAINATLSGTRTNKKMSLNLHVRSIDIQVMRTALDDQMTAIWLQVSRC
jgi:tripartite-type tricarboxylate transporter receptor subunit TctC